MKLVNEKRNLTVAIVIIIIVFFGVGYVIFQEINRVYQASEWRERSHQIITHTQRLLTQSALAEEAQRSFLITDDENYLTTFYSSVEMINPLLLRLKFLIGEDSTQYARVDTLGRLINFRMESLQQKIEYQKNGNKEAAIEYLSGGLGSKYMNSIRRLTSIIMEDEYKSLRGTDDEVVDLIKSTSVTVIVGTFAGSVILLALYYLLFREVNERKQTEKYIRNQNEFLDSILESSVDGIVAFNRHLVLTQWNSGMENLTGIDRNNIVGKKVSDVPVFSDEEELENCNSTLRGNYEITKDKWFSIPHKNKEGYYEAYYSPLHDANQEVIGGLAIYRNTTQRKLAVDALEKANVELEGRVLDRTKELSRINEELKKEICEREKIQEQVNNSLQEKIVLLREIHHRVKNNLQVISSLLSLQSGYITDENAKQIFKESQSRVRSMALIHEKLYQSNALNKIDFEDYVKTLTRELASSYRTNTNQVSFHVNVEDVFMEIDKGILCGLIINELVSNALKHAFPKGQRGDVFVDIKQDAEGIYKFMVKDNGIGFPQDIDYRETDSLGMQLVNTLTEQLDGKITLDNENGTEFRIEFS